MRKRSLTIWVLVLMMALLTSCGAASQVSAWEYDAETHTLYINSDKAMQAYVPDKENEEGTTTNAPWAAHLPEIENIVVGDEVTYIGEYAFAFCSSLKTVVAGKGVQELGERCIYRSGDFENKSDMALIFNRARVATFGEDVFGYTWDNGNAVLFVPVDQQIEWRAILGDRPMRIANMK